MLLQNIFTIITIPTTHIHYYTVYYILLQKNFLRTLSKSGHLVKEYMLVEVEFVSKITTAYNPHANAQLHVLTKMVLVDNPHPIEVLYVTR